MKKIIYILTLINFYQITLCNPTTTIPFFVADKNEWETNKDKRENVKSKIEKAENKALELGQFECYRAAELILNDPNLIETIYNKTPKELRPIVFNYILSTMIMFYADYLETDEDPDSKAIKHILTVIHKTVEKFSQYDINNNLYSRLIKEKQYLPLLLLLLSHQRNTEIIDKLMKQAERSGDQSIVDILEIIKQYPHNYQAKHDSRLLIEDIYYDEDKDKKENALKALGDAGLPMYVFTSEN